MAVQNGTAPPTHVSILVLAERWGCPPWEITGEEPNETNRQKWYERAVLYISRMNIRKENEMSKFRA